jgi:hypothetical protein
MLFKTRFHHGLRDGSIDRTYRRWKSPQVKVGGIYRFASRDALEVTSVEVIRARDLSAEDARRAGFDSLAQLRAEIERSGRQPLEDESEITRVEFTHRDIGLRPEPPSEVSAGEVEQVVSRIQAMEVRSASGPWVWQTLELIAAHPKRRAPELAAMLGAEVQPFKSRVRRLKGLGLTQSFEVGYAVTALGQAALQRQKTEGGSEIVPRASELPTPSTRPEGTSRGRS